MLAALVLQLAVFDTPAEAMRELIDRKPRVIAFGEYHETKQNSTAAKPAIVRFTNEVLQTLPPASDVIVETWVTRGNCGATEKTVVAKVEQSTQRPESTETDIVKLVRLAREQGHAPHILELTCDEYQSLQAKDGDLDYVKLLSVVTEQLQKKILARLGTGKQAVVVYGGALHNDLFPRKELAPFSFARPVKKAAGGRYLEVDLYIREYVSSDKEITSQPWWKRYEKMAQPGKVVRVKRGEGSYILIL